MSKRRKPARVQVEASRLLKLLTHRWQKPVDLGGDPRLRQKALLLLVKQGQVEQRDGQTDPHFVSHRQPKEYRLAEREDDDGD